MRHTVLYFSPTGGVRRAAMMLASGIGSDFQGIDLSISLSGRQSVSFTPQDVCIIAMPSFSGRAPEVAIERLARIPAGGARAVLLSVYGNRSDEDTLYDMRDAARKAGFVPVAAVRAIAQHSIISDVAAGRPDAQDEEKLIAFGREIAVRLESEDCAEVALEEKTMLRPYGSMPLHPRAGKRCTGCGKCASLCPVSAIQRDNPRLTNERECITCMRCVAVCPEHARRLNPLLVKLAGRKLMRACAQRKEPELILGDSSGKA